MKKTYGLCLILFIVTLLISCGMAPGKGQRNNFANGGEEQITLRLAWWGEQPRHDYTLQLIEMYEELNPNINIESQFFTWDDYWSELMQMAATGTLPDIIQMDTAYIVDFAENGLLTDLSPLININLIDTHHVDEELFQMDNSDYIYGLPTGYSVLTVFANKQILDNVGIDLDHRSWTWDDFEKLSIRIKEETGKFGSNAMNPAVIFFSTYLKTKGHELYNRDGNALGYNDDQLFIDYFNMQLRMVKASSIPTFYFNSQIDSAQEDELMLKGEIAFYWGWSNNFITLKDLTDDEYIPMFPPEIIETKKLSMKPTMFWSISSDSKYIEEAGRFLDFYTNSIEANRLINGERGIPLSTIVTEELQVGLSKEEKGFLKFIDASKEYMDMLDATDPGGASEVMALLDELSFEILSQTITPEQGAKMFREKANRILGGN